MLLTRQGLRLIKRAKKQTENYVIIFRLPVFLRTLCGELLWFLMMGAGIALIEFILAVRLTKHTF